MKIIYKMLYYYKILSEIIVAHTHTTPLVRKLYIRVGIIILNEYKYFRTMKYVH